MSLKTYQEGKLNEMLVEDVKPSLLRQSSDDVTCVKSKTQDVQLCRICFTTDSKLNTMKVDKYLGVAYGTLTGLSIEDEDGVPPYLCVECSQQLMCFIHFKKKSLRAHLLLLDILRRHDCITLETIKTLNETQTASTSNFENEHNVTDHLFLETTHIKKENIETDELTCLTNEPYLNHIVAYKDENKDYILSNSSPKNYDFRMCNLHEGANLDDLKVEYDNEISKECINDTNMINSNLVNSELVGKEYSSDYLREQTQDELDMTNIEGTNILKSQININRNLKQKSGERLLSYNKLCCDMCPYKTVSDVQLLKHLKNHPRKKVPSSCKPYTCGLCKKSLSTKCSLQKHMKTHSDDKKYKCDLCKKGFIEKHDLQNHLRTHSGEKPYGCDLCKKKFSERGNLLRHIRIHSGNKPFSCKVCCRPFNQRHHLKRHMIKHKGRVAT